jgi:heme A synthase
MTNIPKDQQPERNESGCLSTIFFWAGVLAFFLFAGWVDSFFPREEKMGESIVVWGIMLSILGAILYGMGSSTIKDTAKNLLTLAKWFAALLVLAWLLPSSCTHNDSSLDENTYYRR